MSCALFDLQIVSDDLQDRDRAREHARDCPRCAAILQGQSKLALEVADWREAVEVPPGLEERVLTAVERASVPRLTDRRRSVEESATDRRRPVLWPVASLALAATLILGVALGLFLARLQPRAPEVADNLLVEEALEAAELAEMEHARAIARLEQEADPILALASDPETPSRDAAILLAYRDRLAFLDATIAEVREFVDGNPGNADARTVLLAAYKEKTQVLREIVSLEVTS